MAITKPADKATYFAAATDAKTPVQDRIAALRRTASQVCESNDKFNAVLSVVRNVKEPIEVRLAALQALQAAAFTGIPFEPYRGSYITALRSLANDANADMRERVLGILAREKDGPTQEKLLTGLQDEAQALVPPEKALQLLSYDVHTGAFAAARKIIKDPPNETAKHEALRLLGADASAAPLFEKLLRDKSESFEVRQICAAALQGVKPKRYQALAREIVLDDNEDKDIRAHSLAALTHFGDAESLAADGALMKQVAKLKAKAPAKVKKGASLFLKKYGN